MDIERMLKQALATVCAIYEQVKADNGGEDSSEVAFTFDAAGKSYKVIVKYAEESI